MARRDGTKTAADAEHVPEWVRQAAPDACAVLGITEGVFSDRDIIRVTLRAWRVQMGFAGRTEADRPLSMRLAALWVETPARTWEAWELGRRLPPPCLWGRLRQLLRDSKACTLHVQDEPKRPEGREAWPAEIGPGTVYRVYGGQLLVLASLEQAEEWDKMKSRARHQWVLAARRFETVEQARQVLAAADSSQSEDPK